MSLHRKLKSPIAFILTLVLLLTLALPVTSFALTAQFIDQPQFK